MCCWFWSAWGEGRDTSPRCESSDVSWKELSASSLWGLGPGRLLPRFWEVWPRPGRVGWSPVGPAEPVPQAGWCVGHTLVLKPLPWGHVWPVLPHPRLLQGCHAFISTSCTHFLSHLLLLVVFAPLIPEPALGSGGHCWSCCPLQASAALGHWELLAAFGIPWVSSPHWGLGSWLGRVCFAKTNKHQAARPSSVWCFSAQLQPCQPCCGMVQGGRWAPRSCQALLALCSWHCSVLLPRGGTAGLGLALALCSAVGLSFAASSGLCLSTGSSLGL